MQCAFRVVRSYSLSVSRGFFGSIENATQQDFFIHLQLNHAVEIKPISQKDVIERNGLGNGARKSVEYESILTIRPKNALSDYGNHKLVWYKLTTFHYRLGFSPDRSFCRHGGAQHIAGGQLRNS